MEKLWVLKYKIGDLEIFLTPENAHSVHLKDALKFNSLESCKNYITKSFLEFEPSLEEIPDYKNNCLQPD